jgi:hypothetical protein
MATAAWATTVGAQTGTATTTAVLPTAPSTTRVPAGPAATRAEDAAVECPTTTPTSEKFAAARLALSTTKMMQALFI